jgi:hypothetical protein
MNVDFIEKYDKLSDMKEGDTATSQDRKSFFVCGHHYDKLKKQNARIILDLNNLYDQYTEKRDMNQPIKILESGDRFVCSR